MTVTTIPFTARESSWEDFSLCGGMDTKVFFPDTDEVTGEAESACRSCLVGRDCLTYALKHPGEDADGGWGTWGGTSAPEREALLARFGGRVTSAVASVAAEGRIRNSDYEIAA
jgi:hypothetical protein